MKWLFSNLIAMLAIFALAALCAPEAIAQEEPPETGEEEAAAEEAQDEAAEEEETEADDEDADAYLAVVGARVHTVSGAVLDGATVLAKNGEIVAIGPNVNVPDTAEVIDGTGKELYPGLIAVRSTGLLSGSAPDDGSTLFSLPMAVALAGGITTVESSNTAAKLTFDSLDDMVIKRNLFESVRYDTRSPNNRRRLRQQLDRCRDHLRDMAEWEEARRTDPEAEKPDERWIRGDFEKYMRLLKGESRALVDAADQHDLLQICALAEEYGIKFIIRGAREGWTVAPQLARAGAWAMVTPRDEVAQNEQTNRPTGSNVENAAILYEHGVLVSIIPAGSLFGPGSAISFGGLAGRDLAHLQMEAAFAVRGGLSNAQAVRSITLDAARILGIDDRVGSIDVGKDADFIITDGDVLHYMTQVQYTIVNGRVLYDKDNDTLYSHIRPGGDLNAPPPTDHWPRRLGQDW